MNTITQIMTAMAAGMLATAAVAGEVGAWTYGAAAAPGDELNGVKAGGDIDVWDIDATRPMTWIPEKHAVEVTLKLRQRKRTVKSVLLTRYFKEQKVRTYFDPVAPCAACEDEIAPGHDAASPVGQY